MPTISVVIALYNKLVHIGRALSSILSQTYQPDEVIVVDDGSTDGGPEIVKAFQDPRIILIQQENQGAPAARNRAVDQAKGELITLLDADDAWEPGFLEEILRLREKYPQAGLFATAYQIVNPSGVIIHRDFQALLPGIPDGILINYFKIGLNFPVWSSAVGIPKKIYQEVGGFKVGEPTGYDHDLWLRLVLRYPFAWSRSCMATYYENAVNRSAGIRLWRAEPAISRSAREAIKAGLVPPGQIRDMKEYVAFFQVRAINDLLRQGNKDEALKVLAYSRGTQRFARKWWKWRVVAALPGDSARLWKLKKSIKRWLMVSETPDKEDRDRRGCIRR